MVPTSSETLQSAVDTAVLRGHVMVDTLLTTEYAPGVFARCINCGAQLRWYQGSPCGEAYVTWCPYVAKENTLMDKYHTEATVRPKQTAPQNQMSSDEELAAARKAELDEQDGNLNWWRDTLMDYAREKGWLTSPEGASVGDLIALMHTELSEAYEEYRNGHEPNETYYNVNEGNVIGKAVKPEGIPSEIIDVIIRALHFCGIFGIDVDAMMREKHEYNMTREYRHGGKRT